MTSSRSLLCCLAAFALLCVPSVEARRLAAPVDRASHTSVQPPTMSSVQATPLLHARLAEDRTTGRHTGELREFAPTPFPSAPPCGLSPCDAPAETVTVARRDPTCAWANDEGNSPLLTDAHIDAQFATTNGSLAEVGHSFHTHGRIDAEQRGACARRTAFLRSARHRQRHSVFWLQCNVSVTGFAGGDCIDLPPAPQCPSLTRNGIVMPCATSSPASTTGVTAVCRLLRSSCSAANQVTHCAHGSLRMNSEPCHCCMEKTRCIQPDAFNIDPVQCPPAGECPLGGAITTMPMVSSKDEREP